MNKIACIKIIREVLGVGLYEAKQCADRLESEGFNQGPNLIAAPRSVRITGEDLEDFARLFVASEIANRRAANAAKSSDKAYDAMSAARNKILG